MLPTQYHESRSLPDNIYICVRRRNFEWAKMGELEKKFYQTRNEEIMGWVGFHGGAGQLDLTNVGQIWHRIGSTTA